MIEELVFEPSHTLTFFLGAITPLVLGCLVLSASANSWVIGGMLLLVPPLPLLVWRRTRMFGTGWLISVAMALLFFWSVCGGFKGF